MQRLSMIAMPPQIDRFWSKVITKGAEECWPWIGGTTPFGHGVFRWNGKNQIASRLVWQMYVGIIPNGLCILHRCDNPRCCNPEHLFLGTKKHNTDDMINKGRQKFK